MRNRVGGQLRLWEGKKMNTDARVQRILDAEKALHAFIGTAMVLGQPQSPTPVIDEDWRPALDRLEHELNDSIADLMQHRGQS
jgi:hypothetical protein